MDIDPPRIETPDTKQQIEPVQDGLLSYYLEQVPKTDWYCNRASDTEPFDYRNLIAKDK